MVAATPITMLMCSMIRNETNYLVEWIEFHKMQVRFARPSLCRSLSRLMCVPCVSFHTDFSVFNLTASGRVCVPCRASTTYGSTTTHEKASNQCPFDLLPLRVVWTTYTARPRVSSGRAPVNPLDTNRCNEQASSLPSKTPCRSTPPYLCRFAPQLPVFEFSCHIRLCTRRFRSQVPRCVLPYTYRKMLRMVCSTHR